jgi:hypothetical protein
MTIVVRRTPIRWHRPLAFHNQVTQTRDPSGQYEAKIAQPECSSTDLSFANQTEAVDLVRALVMSLRDEAETPEVARALAMSLQSEHKALQPQRIQTAGSALPTDLAPRAQCDGCRAFNQPVTALCAVR